MGMENAGNVGPRGVYTGVNVQGWIDVDVLTRQNVQFEIRLVDQVGRDFAEPEIVHMEQKRFGPG